MDLQEFVTQSLVQIAKGIEKANEELRDSGAMINPLHITANTGSAQTYARTGQPNKVHPDSRIVEKVEFDVAVVAEAGEQTQAGLKIAVASIGIGAGGQSDKTNKSESRIRFAIPVVLPGIESNT